MNIEHSQLLVEVTFKYLTSLIETFILFNLK